MRISDWSSDVCSSDLADQPHPPAYLIDSADQANGGLSIRLEAHLSTAAMREAGDDPVKIVGTDARYLYWTFAQMIKHQRCGGTNFCQRSAERRVGKAMVRTCRSRW